MKAKKIDTSMAEKWLDPDTFVYRGKVYRINPNSKIVQEIIKGGTK